MIILLVSLLLVDPLLDIELQGPLREGLHLGEQFMGPILTSDPGVLCLDEVHLERLRKDHNHMAYLPVHLNDQVHHVLSLLLVSLLVVQLIQIVLVSLQRQNLDQTLLVFRECRPRPHVWYALLHVLHGLSYLLDHSSTDSFVNLLAEDSFEFIKDIDMLLELLFVLFYHLIDRLDLIFQFIRQVCFENVDCML